MTNEENFNLIKGGYFIKGFNDSSNILFNNGTFYIYSDTTFENLTFILPTAHSFDYVLYIYENNAILNGMSFISNDISTCSSLYHLIYSDSDINIFRCSFIRI